MEASDISAEELHLRLKLFSKECDFVLLLLHFSCYVDKQRYCIRHFPDKINLKK